MGISSSGIGSGLDVQGIVSQLMSIERQPLTLLQTAKSELQTQVSTIGKLQSYVSSFRDAAAALTSVTTWNATAATSSDATAVAVSAASGAAIGSYGVQVQNLAAGQTATSRAFASSSATLSSGSLLIELGSWVGDPATGFTGKAGSVPVTVNILPGETDLAHIRDKINAANAGVTATVINDATGARLSIRSRDTGAENAFRISATEDSDDGDAAAGLSALGYDATVASQMTRNASAVNARATINGIEVTSASNKLEGVADGLTMTLLKPTTTAVEVGVAADSAAIRKNIEDFAKAFNDLAGYIKEQTKYNAETKKAGTLQGDRTVIGLQNALREIINTESNGSAVFKTLSDIGLSMKSDGTLETKSSKLDAGMANLAELRKLFAADGATNADDGFMTRFKALADNTLGIDGSFETRNASLQRMLTVNTKRQDAMEDRLEQKQKRLLAQYQALDTKMAQLSGLSSYVSQQMSLINKS